MACPGQAVLSGVNRNFAPAIDNLNLTMSLADVVAFHDFQSVRRRMTVTQELQPINAVVRIDQRLRGNSADVACDEWHHGSSCKKSGSDCHSQLTGYFVPCHDRPSHRLPPYLSVLHTEFKSPRWNSLS